MNVGEDHAYVSTILDMHLCACRYPFPCLPFRRSHGALCACTAINMKGKLPRILHGGGRLSMRSRIQCIVKSTFSETRLVPGMIKMTL